MTAPIPDPTDDPLAILQEHARGERRRRGWTIAALLLLIGLAAAAMLAFRRDRADPGVEFIGVEARRGDLTVTVTATGALEPLTQVDVGSELSGTVEEVHVDFNDRVTRGQVLARLDTDRLDAVVVQSRGALAAAQARLGEAEATAIEAGLRFTRCEKLAARALCSTDELDGVRATRARAEAGVTSAQAQVASARATLAEHETDLAKALIRAPIDGIVLKRQIEPGQTVAAALQTPVLFTLAENLAQMRLRVAVDEADIGHVREGQHATFSVDAYPKRSFPATIVQVRYAPETVDGVVTYGTVLTVANPDLALRPGMTATAEIVVREVRAALLVPNAALRFAPPAAPAEASAGNLVGRLLMRYPRRTGEQRTDTDAGGARVWVLDGGRARAVSITVGASDEAWTEVTGGPLRDGQQVAVDYVPPRE